MPPATGEAVAVDVVTGVGAGCGEASMICGVCAGCGGEVGVWGVVPAAAAAKDWISWACNSSGLTWGKLTGT